ncbi:hypothetical protein BDW74DRAFT_182260 [Aspergillus multicolor]|uniref:uncharacterized protein n=1 Tax=Aspergillus multicolor TaxID=41759 RepID=UPI003CCCF399
MASPTPFKETFNKKTEVYTVGHVKILAPPLLLNAKCRSILERTDPGKKLRDKDDIVFLLRWCARHPEYLPTEAEVSNATSVFVHMFIGKFGEEDAWTDAGYDLSHGRFKQA